MMLGIGAAAVLVVSLGFGLLLGTDGRSKFVHTFQLTLGSVAGAGVFGTYLFFTEERGAVMSYGAALVVIAVLVVFCFVLMLLNIAVAARFSTRR